MNCWLDKTVHEKLLLRKLLVSCDASFYFENGKSQVFQNFKLSFAISLINLAQSLNDHVQSLHNIMIITIMIIIIMIIIIIIIMCSPSTNESVPAHADPQCRPWAPWESRPWWARTGRCQLCLLQYFSTLCVVLQLWTIGPMCRNCSGRALPLIGLEGSSAPCPTSWTRSPSCTTPPPPASFPSSRSSCPLNGLRFQGFTFNSQPQRIGAESDVQTLMDLPPSSEINMVLHLFIRWAVVLGRILASVSLRQSCSTSPSWSSSYRRSSRSPPRWKWSKQVKASFNLVPPRQKTKKEEPHCTMRRPSTTVESSTGSKS